MRKYGFNSERIGRQSFILPENNIPVSIPSKSIFIGKKAPSFTESFPVCYHYQPHGTYTTFHHVSISPNDQRRQEEPIHPPPHCGVVCIQCYNNYCHNTVYTIFLIGCMIHLRRGLVRAVLSHRQCPLALPSGTSQGVWMTGAEKRAQGHQTLEKMMMMMMMI